MLVLVRRETSVTVESLLHISFCGEESITPFLIIKETLIRVSVYQRTFIHWMIEASNLMLDLEQGNASSSDR